MVDTVLVVPLVVLLTVAVLQVALVLHVRSALTSAAGEAARAAALAGSDPGAARRRVSTLLDGSIAGATVRTVQARTATEGGLPVVEVRIEATLPLLGLLGPPDLTVEGHAFREDRS